MRIFIHRFIHTLSTPIDAQRRLWIAFIFLIHFIGGCENQGTNKKEVQTFQKAKVVSLIPKNVANVPTSRPNALPTLRSLKGLMFVYFDRGAEMRTVDRPNEIELHARRAVMIIDPNRRLKNDQIIVADLSSKKSDLGYRQWIESRSQWIATYMPKRSQLKTPIKVVKKKKTKKWRRKKKRKRFDSKPIAVAKTKIKDVKSDRPKIIIFSTPWCPSCRHAKAYFSSLNLSFIDYNVEKNQQAARQMLMIQRQKGMKEGAIPLILIGNQVFQGFAKARMEYILKQSGLIH